jgi:hypothetical protein
MLVVFGVIGCGGGGGAITRTLVSNFPEQVTAGTVCIDIEGPYSVRAGSMAFTVTDTPTGIGDDKLEVGIISDAVLASAGCDFNQAVVDDVGVGSLADSGPVPAGTYDFIVGCGNSIDPCLFNLTWTATY